MDAKLNTDNYSNSGNDTNSEENDSRRRTDDTDEVNLHRKIEICKLNVLELKINDCKNFKFCSDLKKITLKF